MLNVQLSMLEKTLTNLISKAKSFTVLSFTENRNEIETKRIDRSSEQFFTKHRLFERIETFTP